MFYRQQFTIFVGLLFVVLYDAVCLGPYLSRLTLYTVIFATGMTLQTFLCRRLSVTTCRNSREVCQINNDNDCVLYN